MPHKGDMMTVREIVETLGLTADEDAVRKMAEYNAMVIAMSRKMNLTGIKDAISTAFPKTEQQRCIVHMVRNTLKYVANKDMKSFAKDLKTIYTAADEEAARKQLKGHYPSAMNRWHDNWDAISPIFKFSKEVRTAFYTTNAIESLNSCYRRLNKQRSVFPSSQALMKALWQQAL